MSDDAKAVVEALLIFSMATVLSGLRKIERWEAMHPNDPDRNRVRLKALELEGELAMLDAKLAALEADANRLKRPTEKQVNGIIEAVDAVERDIAAAQSAKALLALVGKTVAIINDVRGLSKAEAG